MRDLYSRIRSFQRSSGSTEPVKKSVVPAKPPPEHLANLATKEGVEGHRFKIHVPLIHMSKGEIIKAGTLLGVDYSLTHSCYDPSPDGLACGRCDSCKLRKKGFKEAGIPDPTLYMKTGS